MAIKIKFRANSTPGAVPNTTVAADMYVGELVVNTADGLLWVKHSNGSLIMVNATGDVGPPGGSPPSGGGGGDSTAP